MYKSSNEEVRRFDPQAKYDIIYNLHDNEVAKIIVPAGLTQHTLEEVTKMETYLSERFKDLHIIKISYAGSYGFDITSSKASKHIAVLEFMKIMNLQPEDVVGIGDGYNDYPLLTACGTKVAMADAPPELRAIADFVAPPQSENGILKVIEKYFKI